MPRYSYSIMDKSGQREIVVERVFPMGKQPNHVILEDGRRADRDMAMDFLDVAVSADYAKPIHSTAMGWHPSQREEVMAAARRESVPLELAPSRDGSVLQAVFRNPRQRRKVLRWRKLIDRESFY